MVSVSDGKAESLGSLQFIPSRSHLPTLGTLYVGPVDKVQINKAAVLPSKEFGSEVEK
jgi:hypothetical protein